MKLVKLSFIFVLVALVTLGLGSASYAFHSGGVAECEGCHTMHNSLDGVANAGLDHNGNPIPGYKGSTTPGSGNAFLLKGSDQSSTCLNCHLSDDTVASANGTYHIASGATAVAAGLPVQMTPGGDFAWTQLGFAYNAYGNQTTVTGEEHGHSINAADFGYPATGPLAGTPKTVAPGSTALYPQAGLHCSSCHDPHGKYRRLGDSGASGSWVLTGAPTQGSGSYINTSVTAATSTLARGAYRILAGNGYQPKSLTGSYKFTADPPVAVVASVYNRSEINSETKQSYGSGMSEWCANCHDKFLENAYVSGATGHRHPAGNSAKLSGGWSAELGVAMPIYQNYNQYVTSGIMNATATANYTTLVPFETGDTTFSAASTNANLGAGLAATATSNVMCLSCHRAHASGFPSMTRWNNEAEMMTLIASNGTITYQSNPVKASGLSPSQTQRALYERPASVFGAYARVLCNKCHAKD